MPDVAGRRALSRQEKKFLKDRMRCALLWINCTRSVNNDVCWFRSDPNWDGVVSLPMFRAFWEWFVAVHQTLQRLQDVWCQTSPVLIHGFLSRNEAEAMVSAHRFVRLRD
jgi:hypothetical protein